MTTHRQTLLAKLAPTFVAQTENVAVEALGHVLSGSAAVRKALTQVVRAVGCRIGHIRRIATQAADEQGRRPDLAGYDGNGTECLLIEAKFWAGLTENQPVAYLERLPGADTPSALLFVAPRDRIGTLWAELQRRLAATDDGVSFANQPTDCSEVRSAAVGSRRSLILVSWEVLLGRLATAAAADADSYTERDIEQLRGLAQREDDEAFLPLTSRELGPKIARRLMGLNNLVDRATERLEEQGVASTKELRVAPKRDGYGRYLNLGGSGAWLGLDYGGWAKVRDTPLWVHLYGPSWSRSEPFRRNLMRLVEPREYEVYDRATPGDVLRVPVFLRVGVEEDAVLADVVRQLKELAELIGRAIAAAE